MQVRKVDAGRGWNWIADGFLLFKQSPLIWIALFFVYILIGMALSLVPLVGSLAFNLIAPVFVAGFMLGCRALEMGEDLEINHLFAGFQQNAAQLITVGGIYLAGIIVIAGVVVLVGGGAALVAMPHQHGMAGNAAMPPAAGVGMLLVILVMLLCILPLIMAYWFAPALVVFHDLPAVAAMKLSFQACLRNMLPFLVYGLISMLLMVVAIIPFFLGLLVLVPTMTASLYTSYKDIFDIHEPAEEEATAEV